jgi:hypothetical protein
VGVVGVGGIADLGGASTHQDDRLVAPLLEPAQLHDLDEIADVKARRGSVEADVARDHLPFRERVQPRRIGELVDVAALVEQLEEGGAVHGCVPLHGRWSLRQSVSTAALRVG